MQRRKHDVSEHRFVVEQIELLKYHPHMTAVDIDIYAHIGDVDAPKDNRAARRVFHAVQAAQKCAFSTSGRTNDGNLFALSDGG